MTTLGLIGCVKTKRDGEHPARRLYDSWLFDGRVRAVESNCDDWAILSAKYGFVDPDEVIDTYDQHISDVDIRRWSGAVIPDVLDRLESRGHDRVYLLAGRGYAEPLIPLFEELGIDVDDPLEGVPLFDQRSALEQLSENTESTAIGDFQ